MENKDITVADAAQSSFKRLVKKMTTKLNKAKSSSKTIQKVMDDLKYDFELADDFKWIKKLDVGIYDSVITLFKNDSKLDTILPLVHTALKLFLSKTANTLNVDMSDLKDTRRTPAKYNKRIMKELSWDKQVATVNYVKLLIVFNDVRNKNSHAHNYSGNVDKRVYTSLIYSVCSYVRYIELLMSMRGEL